MDHSKLRKESGFVIARSEATKQSALSNEKNEIASLPSVARNDNHFLLHPISSRGIEL
jgi:hypothetical protein